jgi:hypothetical protein
MDLNYGEKLTLKSYIEYENVKRIVCYFKISNII